MQEELLRIEGLTKRFEGFTLSDFNIRVEPGSIVGFVGANGAGKTTTVKCLLGTVFPDEGSIRLFGCECAASDPSCLSRGEVAELRQHLGYVPDTCAFPQDCSVKTAGRMCARAFDAWDDGKFAAMCERFGLESGKKVKELSRGMGMKLSLACALAHSPRLLVLDEATAGLDPLAREEMLALLREYVADEQHGVLISSHITSDLERAADRIVCIDAGRLLFDMATEDITDTAGLAHCRTSDLELVASSRAFEPGELRLKRGPYSIELLVPNRFEFSEAFPEIAVDRISIDEYLSFVLKGEQL